MFLAAFAATKVLLFITFAITGLGTSLAVSSGLALMQFESAHAAQGRTMAALNVASEGARLMGVVVGPAILAVMQPPSAISVAGGIMLSGAFVSVLLLSKANVVR